MQRRPIHGMLAATLMAISMASHAEEAGFAAKSLFFGEDGDVKAVATAGAADVATAGASKGDGKAVAIATTPRRTPVRSKTAGRSDARELPIGAAYFVRLKKPDGTSEDTLSTRAFATGDKFQLGLKVNRPSHVYIFNEDPQGHITMLYPRPGRSAAVDAMGTVFLPSQGAFEFQGPAGLEKLLVLMSDDEVFQPDATLRKIQPDLVTRAVKPPVGTAPSPATGSPVTAGTALASAPGGCHVAMVDAGGFASKAIVYAQDSGAGGDKTCADGESERAPLFASKAIVFADDPQPAAGQQVASYVVKPQAAGKKEPLLLKIQLAHR